jgi:hypothetical protein
MKTPPPSADAPFPKPRGKRILKAPIGVKPPVAPGDPDPRPGAGTGLPLPHERDESVGSVAAEPDPVIEQARRDIESGQVDTDLHNPPGLDAERRDELLRRGGR